MPRITPYHPQDNSVEVRHLDLYARGVDPWLPTSAIAQSILGKNISGEVTALSTGRLTLSAIGVIPGNVKINSITFCSSNTALATGSNQWFCLVDQSLNVLTKTVDDTTAAWGANAQKTLTISGGYTPPNDIKVYAGIVVVATTVPILRGMNLSTNVVTQITPQNAGSSTTGLTNPASLGATAAAISGNTQLVPWCYVS